MSEWSDCICILVASWFYVLNEQHHLEQVQEWGFCVCVYEANKIAKVQKQQKNNNKKNEDFRIYQQQGNIMLALGIFIFGFWNLNSICI